jgi:carnitine O-acetyltransferase
MAIRKFLTPSSLDSKLAAEARPSYTEYLLNEKDINKNIRQSCSLPVITTPTATMPKSEPEKAGVTYAFQDKLPQLPIPELEDTVQRYLDSLRPLQSEREHEESKVAAREFLKYDGPKLQDKLKQYAEGKSNYIEQFCKFVLCPSSCFD